MTSDNVFVLYYIDFFRIVCSVLTVSLDCSLLIAPSVFDNVYLYTRETNQLGKANAI